MAWVRRNSDDGKKILHGSCVDIYMNPVWESQSDDSSNNFLQFMTYEKAKVMILAIASFSS